MHKLTLVVVLDSESRLFKTIAEYENFAAFIEHFDAITRSGASFIALEPLYSHTKTLVMLDKITQIWEAA